MTGKITDNLGRSSGLVKAVSAGRTGTVDWDTTAKTASFTAVSGNGYFCNTADSGAFTLTLPTSPSAGDIVGLKDYNGNFATANLTIGRGGSAINGGSAVDPVISTDGAAIFLVYVDASQGWVATQDDSSTFAGVSFLTATGGTITTCGNDKIHTFTGPGTFCVSGLSSTAADNLVSYLVVAGGGGGGGGAGSGFCAGGGGAGGFRETKSPATNYTASPLDGYGTPGNRITVTAQGYPITIGAGGAGKPGTCNGAPAGDDGSTSTGFGLTSAGGGGGGSRNTPSGGVHEAKDGGSGGGAGQADSCAQSNTFGSGNTPPLTPSQGNNGGRSAFPTGTPSDSGAGAGGGAGAVGGNATPGPSNAGGCGGAGVTTNINGSPTAFAGGGGGSGFTPSGALGGAGGGGKGSNQGHATENGTANTGGGGGGGSGNSCRNGGTGGSGIVIIRYKFQ